MSPSEIIQKLLASRGFSTQKEIAELLHPRHPDQINWSDFNILDTEIQKALSIIQKHIQKHYNIIIYGDYDVDGLCSTAILWQTIYANYKNVFPHIPDRRSEGYGLSQAGIDHCIDQGAKLIITVDSGIVAHDQIAYAKKHGLDVIIIDHHEKSDVLPPADAIIHSTSTCAAGLSYYFSRDIKKSLPSPKLGEGSGERYQGELLDLAALAVICDLVPLTGINRSLAKYGLEALNKTTRPGLLALYEIAGIKQRPSPGSGEGSEGEVPKGSGISSYHVGFIIGPRLNATGRLTHAMDSLRLLCTSDSNKAAQLAQILNVTNIKRQQLTESLTQHALSNVKDNSLIIVADETYDEGVIGLIAAKLVEKYYRPAIAISVGKDVCKASARSIPGFHITEFLRDFSDLFTSVGGHSMAAGFSFPTASLSVISDRLVKTPVPKDLLVKKDRYDLDLPLELVSWDLYLEICKLEPFGLGNPTPVFRLQNTQISDVKTFGKTTRHLKFTVSQNGITFSCVWFSPPSFTALDASRRLGLMEETGVSYEMYYQIDLDSYRGPGNLQLIVKNLKEL